MSKKLAIIKKLAGTSVWRGGATTKKVHRAATGGAPPRLVVKQGKVVLCFSIPCGPGWSNVEVHLDKADYRLMVDAMFESFAVE